MLIYKATNKRTGKEYVGQSILPLDKRQQNHTKSVRQGSTTHFHNALRKNGVAGFDWKIICEVNNKTCLDNYEAYYIKEFNTLTPNGYNLTSGGGTCVFSEETKQKMSESARGPRKSLSEETKKKISEAQMGEKNHRCGKSHTDEHKQKISESQMGEKNHFYGKTHIDETKLKISAAAKKRKVSDETRKRMSEATKLWWKNRQGK